MTESTGAGGEQWVLRSERAGQGGGPAPPEHVAFPLSEMGATEGLQQRCMPRSGLKF